MSSKITGLYFKFFQMFDQSKSEVELVKRIGGYVFDWIVGGILTGLPAVLLYGAITGRNDMFSDLYVFEALGYSKSYGLLAGGLCVLFALFYYVYVPLKIYKGQTLGKRIAGFKIVKLDGEDVDVKTLCIRQILGLFLIESAALVVSNYIRQLVSISFNFYVDYYWALAGMLITLISIIIVLKTQSHRALHDYFAKTKLVLFENKKEHSEEPIQKQTRKAKPKVSTKKQNTKKR